MCNVSPGLTFLKHTVLLGVSISRELVAEKIVSFQKPKPPSKAKGTNQLCLLLLRMC